jgi:GNAT superfamily N-acetyltransferase
MQERHSGTIEPPSASIVRRARRTIWSSGVYRRTRWIGASITRPLRRLDISVIYSKDLTSYTGISDVKLKLDIARCASLDELDEPARLGRPDPRRLELFRSRMRDGCACFVARVGSTMVGYDWIRLRPGVDDGDMIALGKNEVFTFDAYVAEDWRGARVHRAMGAAMLLFAREQGYTTAYTKVGIFNRRSQKSTRRNGWTPSGCVLRVSRGRGWPVIALYGSSHPLCRWFEARAPKVELQSPRG